MTHKLSKHYALPVSNLGSSAAGAARSTAGQVDPARPADSTVHNTRRNCSNGMCQHVIPATHVFMCCHKTEADSCAVPCRQRQLLLHCPKQYMTSMAQMEAALAQTGRQSSLCCCHARWSMSHAAWRAWQQGRWLAFGCWFGVALQTCHIETLHLLMLCGAAAWLPGWFYACLQSLPDVCLFNSHLTAWVMPGACLRKYAGLHYFLWICTGPSTACSRC